MSITIDWFAFLQVFVAAMLATVLVVGFYSLGLRLLVRAGRAPVVSPAEFTDAITVITTKDAAARGQGGGQSRTQEPSHGGAEADRRSSAPTSPSGCADSPSSAGSC